MMPPVSRLGRGKQGQFLQLYAQRGCGIKDASFTTRRSLCVGADGRTVALLGLSLQSLQQNGRGDAHVCGAALQVGRAALLALELLAADGTVGDSGGRGERRRALFVLIQTPAREANTFFFFF